MVFENESNYITKHERARSDQCNGCTAMLLVGESNYLTCANKINWSIQGGGFTREE